MILRDYHAHTTYCDGANTAEEMVLAAIEKGLTEIGISGHSHTAFDESYCMSHAGTAQYRDELLALREKYAGRISIKIGLEMDRYSDADPDGFDYTIGSAHYVRIGFHEGQADCPFVRYQGDPAAVLPEGCLLQESGDRHLQEMGDRLPQEKSSDGSRQERNDGGEVYVYIPIDETADLLRAAADAYYGGDLVALSEHYFATIGEVAEATGCNIVGHFDLISKFNEPWIKAGLQDPTAKAGMPPLIDTEDPRYIAAWKRAVDQLLQADVPFEINTGAMSKQYRSEPYPAKPIRDYIREKGGRFILSSDSHRAETWCYGFALFEGETVNHGSAGEK